MKKKHLFNFLIGMMNVFVVGNGFFKKVDKIKKNIHINNKNKLTEPPLLRRLRLLDNQARIEIIIIIGYAKKKLTRYTTPRFFFYFFD